MAQFAPEFPDVSLNTLLELIEDVDRPNPAEIVREVAWSVGCLGALLPGVRMPIWGLREITPSEMSMPELLTQIKEARLLAYRNRESQIPFPAERMAWLVSVLLEIGIRKTLGAAG